MSWKRIDINAGVRRRRRLGLTIGVRGCVAPFAAVVLFLLFAVNALCVADTALPFVDTTAPATNPATAPATEAATEPTTEPTTQPAVRLAQVVSQNEAVTASVQAIASDLRRDPVVSEIQNDLPGVQRQIDLAQAEMQRVMTAGASLEALRNIETNWQSIGDVTGGWKSDLARRAEVIDADVNTLQQRQLTWSTTLSETRQHNVPDELIAQLTTTNTLIRQVLRLAQTKRHDVLRLQAAATVQDARVIDALHAVNQGRQQVIDHLFMLDSPPIWSSELRQHAGQGLAEGQYTSFSAQTEALSAYVDKQRGRLIGHGFLLAIIAAGLFWAKRRFKSWKEEEPTLAPAEPVFATPIATALVLAVILGIWIHPQAPRLFWTIMGASAMLPALFLLRRLAAKALYPVLYALVIAFFVDQGRALITAIEFWPRVVFLIEMLGAALFLWWYLRRFPPLDHKLHDKATRRRRWAIRFGRLALLSAAAAFVLDAVGFNGLGMFIGNGLLRSAYVGMILYAGVAVADGLVIVMLHLRLIAHLHSIHKYRTLLRERTHRIIGFAAFVYWIWFALDIFSVRAPVKAAIHHALTAEGGIGSIQLSLGNVLAFGITVWASFAISRFSRFVLEEDVYPHVSLPRGLGTAISALFHYGLLLVGFFIAMGMLGFPLTQLGILTGAFGVGLGFGLQTIINNFFSGLIVLIERPVRPGDVIEMDALVGTILRIGIRASVIRTPAGAEIIMPNGRLVAEKVINWTLSDRCRAVDMAFAIDPAADPQVVKKVLTETALKIEHVADEPAPLAQLQQSVGGTATYSLRVWTNLVDNWSSMQSDVTIAVIAALRAANIGMK